MRLNPAGEMVKKWYDELPNKFPEIRTHEMVVMPNHFHCILEIVDGYVHGATEGQTDIHGETIGQTHRSAPTINRVVQWFKTMTTNEYFRGVRTSNWTAVRGTLWQRNYYEHIIRNEESYREIAEYIEQNPLRWATDSLNQ